MNAFGGLAWVAGLSVAKGADLPGQDLFLGEDHRLMVGAMMGLCGLVVLLWSNLRSTA